VSVEFLTIDGRKVRVAQAGDPANQPVLLVHGIGRSLEDWDELSERLASDYRVIRIDTPGFGFSDRLPGPVDHLSLGKGFAPVLDALGETRPVHAIGNSLGGSTIMEFAVAHPERVKSLTLVNSAGFGKTVTPLLRMLAIPVLGWLLTRHLSRQAARMFERAIFVNKAMVTDARVDLAVRVGNHPGNGTFMYRMVRALGTWRGVRPEWRERLLAAVGRHERPVLVIWGDRDQILPADHMETALKTFPRASSHLFRGIGHMPQMETPDETAQLIRDFLAKAQ
jgi:pimeloyl-ACP methyl ester carboxylesterase